jgi:hypothetical protein
MWNLPATQPMARPTPATARSERIIHAENAKSTKNMKTASNAPSMS